MSTSTDKHDAQGRSWDQVTKNGTSSAGSMGAGGTGDSGKLDQQGQGQQSATRTDDLLTDGCDQDTAGDAFHSSGGRVETGLEGIGSMTGGNPGNRQSSPQSGGQGQQGNASGTSATQSRRDDSSPERESRKDR